MQILIASLVERKKSKRAIILKLKETHLPTELWEGKLNEIYKPDEEKENLKEQFDKLLFRYRDLPLNKQKERSLLLSIVKVLTWMISILSGKRTQEIS